MRTLKNQIVALDIDINTNDKRSFRADYNAIVFAHILTTFTNLQYLKFGPSLLCHQRLSFCTPLLTVISTTLLELHVCFDTFHDCLYLLDGRLNQLHTLYANIAFILPSSLPIKNEVNYL